MFQEIRFSIRTIRISEACLDLSLFLIPVFFLFKRSYATSIYGWMFLFFIISKIVKKEWPLIQTPLNKPILLFFLCVLFPTLFQMGFSDTWREIKHFLYGICLFWVLVDRIYHQPLFLKRYLFLLVIFSAFLSADAYFQLYHEKDILGMGLFGSRPTSVFNNPNYLCFFISGTIPALFYFLQEEEKIWIKAIYILLLFSSYMTIMLAGSRSGLLALAFFLIFYIAKEGRTGVWALSGLILGILVLSFQDPMGIKDRFLNLLQSGDIRMSIWKPTMTLLKENPLWGTGLDTYKEVYPLVQTGGESYSFPHNFFLEVWQTSGIFALCFFIYVLYTIVVEYIQTIRRSNGSVYLFVSVVMLFIASVMNIPFFSRYVLFYFWLYLGLLFGSMKLNDTTR